MDNNTEIWKDFDDDNNKLIHIKESDGVEKWYKNDKLTHYKNSISEVWYDENSTAHIKDMNGNETWVDKNGEITRTRTIDGCEKIYENNKIVKLKLKNGYEELRKYDFDSGKLIHQQCNNGCEYWFDKYGIITHIKCVDGSEQTFNVDTCITNIKNKDGNETNYDNNGVLI